MQYFTFPPSPPTYLMAVNRKGDIFGELNYGSSSISDLVWNKNLSKNENLKILYSLFKDSFQSQVWNILSKTQSLNLKTGNNANHKLVQSFLPCL